MSKQRPNLLLCYEQVPDRTDFYFVPSDSDLPAPLFNALMRVNNLIVNSVESAPQNEKQWRDIMYMQAATTIRRDYLEEENTYGQNRFFNLLTPYLLNEDAGPAILNISGTLTLIRTAFIQ